MNYENTLVLFGRSPYVNKIKQYMPKICEKWHTMGVNNFCDTFPKVESVVFNDDICPSFTKKHLVITNIANSSCKRKAGEKLTTHLNKELFYCVPSKHFQLDITQRKLSFFFHTPSIALNWAYLMGFENVVLIGIDLINDTDHFNYEQVHDLKTCHWDENKLQEAREHLEMINGKYLNLYQVTKGNEINLPKLKIGDLI